MTCAFLCAQGIAISEEASSPHLLDIVVTISPCNMAESGETGVRMEITNPSDCDVENLVFSSEDNQRSESLGRLPAGETQIYERNYTVTDGELDAGIVTFLISHDDVTGSGEQILYRAEVPVSRSVPMPEAQFTRQISGRTIHPGDAVTVTYRVKNSGNVPLTQVQVKDGLGDYTGSVDQLSPGEEKRFSNRVTPEGDAVSAPTLRYTLSDGDEFEDSLEDISISVIEPELTAHLQLDRTHAEEGETLTGVVTVSAAGSSMREITVYDAVHGQLLASDLDLLDGQDTVLTVTWPVREPSDYQVYVTGLDEAGGEITALSETVSMELSGEFSFSDLSASAYGITPRINRAGYARLAVEIANTGNSAARNVTLSEASLGTIRTFAIIPEGEPTLRYVDAYVDQDTEFRFRVEYEDESGDVTALDCEPVTVRIDADGVDPVTPEDSEALSRLDSHEIRGSTTYIWMISIGGAVLVILIILLAVSHDRERRARKARREREKQRKRAAAQPRTDKRAKHGGNDV